MLDSAPASVATYRVVIVTLDSHAAGPAARAAARMGAEFPGLSVEVHAAAEWSAHPEALQAAREAVGRADIVVANLLFLEEHVEAIRPALEARREGCDAMVGLIADRAVVRLTRMGDLDMMRPASGVLQILKKLRGGGAGKPASGERQMRMLRRLPKILRYLPGKAQDLRQWFLAMQYWLGGSDENVEAMLRALISRYGREDWRGGEAPAPIEYPDVGLWHPETGVLTDANRLPRPKSAIGTVGLLMMRSYVLSGDTAHYAAVIRSMEAKGLAVIPAFAGGLDGRPAIDAYHAGRVDALVGLTGFSLVGGPAYNDSTAAADALAALDVPYIAAHPLEFQTLEEWERDPRGLGPVETTMLVALPEIDGATNPTVFAGRRSGAADKAMAPCPERIEALAARTREGRRAASLPGGGAQGRDRAVRLPAQCGRDRDGGLSVGVREPARDDDATEGGGLRARRP